MNIVKEHPVYNQKKDEYCHCGGTTVTSELDDFGYWYVCCECGKRKENGYHYFNHYDGEDHDDIDDFEY